MPALIVRSLADDSEVHRVELKSLHNGFVQRVMLGLQHKIDDDRYYVDDSEVTAAQEAAAPQGEG